MPRPLSTAAHRGVRQFGFANSDQRFNTINYALLALVALVYLYPLWFVVIASVSTPAAVWSGEVWLVPKGITFEGYRRILEHSAVWTGYRNTIMYTVVGTAINLALTLTAAYPLSRKDFRGRKPIMIMYTVTMFFSGGLIPLYLLVRSLGILDTFWAMVLPNAVAFWNIVITRTYFQTNIPNELLESAQLDGCRNMRFFWSIVLPLSVPVIAVMTLFYSVMHWNSFFNALIFLADRSRFPLQLVLRQILVLTQVESMMMDMDINEYARRVELAESLKYGLIIVSSLPVLVLYPLMQRHFIRGILIGALKG